ncbi:MAG: hypothetical protein JST54_25240 [Deltaproteobacteria bacterium]|nr:hypothetical protein [Deltaproteobacteria bacterium]
MKSNVLAALVLALAACGGSTTSSNTTTTATGGTHAANGSGTNGSGNNSSGTGASGSTTNGSTGATSTGATSNGTGANTGATSNGTGANTTSTGTNGSGTGNCVPDGQFSSDPNACCSGAVDGNGYCISASVTGATSGTGSNTGATSNGTNGSGTTGSGTSATTGSSTTGATATGTTTGGTCPNNMPNLVTGQGGRGVGACNTSPGAPACPKGYTCIQGQCSLNSSSTLQVTLSFDDIEDFDLHLLEPLPDGGHCEIYYGNPGNNPDSGLGQVCNLFPYLCHDGGIGLPTGGNPCPEGWLDRDTNAACGSSGGSGGSGGGEPDGVNVENILFSNTAVPPSGTYYVLVDYWENCDSTVCSSGQDQNACGGYPTSNLAVQVRLPDSAIYQYCPVISQSGQGPNDSSAAHGGPFPDGAGAGSGFLVTSFTLP